MMKTHSRVLAVMVLSLTSVIITPLQLQATVGDTFSKGNLNYTVLTEEDSTGTVEVKKNEDISGSITIPDSVENNGITYKVASIGDYAFSGCSSLGSITIPDSVTSIGSCAFYECRSLIDIIIPDSVAIIEKSAFSLCTSLTNIIIPDGVVSIEDSAFSACISLTNIVIPDSVISIGDYAFQDCSSLTSITIPASVTSIERYTFHLCFNLTSVMFEGDAPKRIHMTPTGIFNDLCVTVYYYEGTSGWTHTWEGALTQMIELPKVGDCFTDEDFQYRILSIDGATGTVSAEKQFYTIPSGDVSIPATVENSGVTYQVTEIGAHAFDTCYDLTHITIPDSVTVIGAYAFASCFNLSSVSMGNGVKEIGYWVFNRCLALKEIGIPDGVESIKPAAFSDCWSLEKVYFQGDAPELGRDAFWNTEATIYYKEGTTGWTNNPWGGRPTVVIGEEKPVLSYSLDGEDMVLKWEEKAEVTLQVLDEKTSHYLGIKENIHTKDGVCTYRAPMKGVKAFYRLMEK